VNKEEKLKAAVAHATKKEWTWEDWLRGKQGRKELAELIRDYPAKRSVTINLSELPNDVWKRCMDTPSGVRSELYDEIKRHLPEDRKDIQYNVWIKGGGAHHRRIGKIRGDDFYKLISIDCRVMRTSKVESELVRGTFQCDECGTFMVVNPRNDTVKRPPVCTRDGCDCTSISLIVRRSRYIDHQTALLQDIFDEMKSGEQPQTVEVEIDGDLCGQILPGQQVRAMVIRQVAYKDKNQKYIDTDEIQHKNSMVGFDRSEVDFDEIVITEEDEAAIKKLGATGTALDQIAQALAAHIYGMTEVKLGITMLLFGGVNKTLQNNAVMRGNPHILLIGDPGTAKTQLLLAAQRLCPRAVFTSGKGASSAGLTCAAVKEEGKDGKWVLEAGALVLADKSIACVDELEKMAVSERGALHEAMESQTVSVAKAGITATLMSRCSLLGAANPKFGRFDLFQPLHEQINLEPALLSRFDLIFILTDEPSEEHDKRVAEHVLSAHSGTIAVTLDPQFIRKYVAYAKRNIAPKMSDDMRDALIAYYQKMRKSSGGNMPLAITARQLEACVRLSEACARARLSELVERVDVERALKVFDFSLKQVAFDKDTGTPDIGLIDTGISKAKQKMMAIVQSSIKAHEDSKGFSEVDAVWDTIKDRFMSYAQYEETLELMSRAQLILWARNKKAVRVM
jgi:replicative DNA helicase Mcm